jgi:hypothetical protein
MTADMASSYNARGRPFKGGGVQMPTYANLGRNSNVVSFEEGEGFIEVTFQDGQTYLYTQRSAGAANLATMKRLANAGQGLNGFISRVVKKGYERKY